MSEYKKYVSILNETSDKVNTMWRDSNGTKFSNVFLNPLISKLSNLDWSVDRMISETDDAIRTIRKYKEE